MSLTLRGRCAVCGTLVLAVALAVSFLRADGPETDVRADRLTEESLGTLLTSLGIDPHKDRQRYDFRFKGLHRGQEWDLSMSAVLSQDGHSLWVMAWLDELPRSASDVPRTALLRMLALNDTLGEGKFFAYVAANRRFVLQRVVSNQDITPASFRAVLQDLGAAVVQTHPHWSVANWTVPVSATAPEAAPARSPQPVAPRPTQSAINDSKFQVPVRRN